uniref:Uncharacterized protein n=1 Tax=Anguilla anguilla TaxID=7936 RepID=A0A0E9R393_ANGAN
MQTVLTNRQAENCSDQSASSKPFWPISKQQTKAAQKRPSK